MKRGLVILLLAGLALAACGKKGDFRPANEQKPAQYPRTYPS